LKKWREDNDHIGKGSVNKKQQKGNQRQRRKDALTSAFKKQMAFKLKEATIDEDSVNAYILFLINAQIKVAAPQPSVSAATAQLLPLPPPPSPPQATNSLLRKILSKVKWLDPVLHAVSMIPTHVPQLEHDKEYYS